MKQYGIAVVIALAILAGLAFADTDNVLSETVASDDLFSIELQGNTAGHDTEKMFFYTNVRRVQNGRRPVMMDPEMNCRAHAWAYIMKTRVGLFHSHGADNVAGGGVQPIYPMSSFAENIAVGASAKSAVMDMWTNSKGHFANMMVSSHRSVGVAKFSNYTIQVFRSGTRPIRPTCLQRNGLVPPGGSYQLVPPHAVFQQYGRGFA
ncbi:hypothetical protein CL622_02975 [archaeon]|nr:hypothetical protein [archaeon]